MGRLSLDCSSACCDLQSSKCKIWIRFIDTWIILCVPNDDQQFLESKRKKPWRKTENKFVTFASRHSNYQSDLLLIDSSPRDTRSGADGWNIDTWIIHQLFPLWKRFFVRCQTNSRRKIRNKFVKLGTVKRRFRTTKVLSLRIRFPTALVEVVTYSGSVWHRIKACVSLCYLRIQAYFSIIFFSRFRFPL